MRLTLEPTDDPRRYAPLPGPLRQRRVVVEVDGDDLPLADLLDELVRPALLAAGYPATLVLALDYAEAVVLQDGQSRQDAQCHQEEAPAPYRREPARDYE